MTEIFFKCFLLERTYKTYNQVSNHLETTHNTIATPNNHSEDFSNPIVTLWQHPMPIKEIVMKLLNPACYCTSLMIIWGILNIHILCSVRFWHQSLEVGHCWICCRWTNTNNKKKDYWGNFCFHKAKTEKHNWI